MKTANYRAAVIGLGLISNVHIKALEDIGITIVAVCDNKPERAKAMGQQLNCVSYTCHEAMISAGGFDVLHNCLPHYLHAPISTAALEKGFHVVCEKPMATTVADAKTMLAAAAASGAKLEIIFQNRYNPSTMAIKQALDSGELGQVLGGWLRVTWYRGEDYYTNNDWRGRWATEGGGALINQSIHTFDLMNYFLGNPTRVNASVANRAHPSIEVEDVAEGIIAYGDINVSFYINTFHPYNAPVALEIVCENGIAAISGKTATITYKDGREAAKYVNDDTENVHAKDYWGYSHITQIAAFYDALAGKAAKGVCGAEGLRTQRLVNGIYDSSKQRQAISL
ncbi:MAG: Gfo/Idh/MocA family oxidoreductase [Defluviitaleaceae bacterium]|nr:Gfo/Idh/MocA family oxidoreductase [Defluviitaleaceae bacterium]